MNRFFGPVDPYVTLPVAALGSVAVVLLLNGIVLWGLLAGVVAGLLVAFDSWMNRHDDTPPPRPVRYRRTRW